MDIENLSRDEFVDFVYRIKDQDDLDDRQISLEEFMERMEKETNEGRV